MGFAHLVVATFARCIDWSLIESDSEVNELELHGDHFSHIDSAFDLLNSDIQSDELFQTALCLT